jgi:hypothetical protein
MNDAIDVGGGWLEYLDDNHRPYYLNQATKEVTWDHPFPQNRRMSLQPPPPLPQESIFDDDSSADVQRGVCLPPGWSEWTDTSGALYYTHEDGTSTWTRPSASELKLPPQASLKSNEMDIAMRLREASLNISPPANSNGCFTSSSILCSQADLAAQLAQPSLYPPSHNASDPKAAESHQDSWSSQIAENMELLLQPFPSVMKQLRGSCEVENTASPAPQPLTFAWYTLYMASNISSSAQIQPLELDAHVMELAASIYYQSKGGLFKKSRSVEQCVSFDALNSSKPALEVNRDAGESVIALCRRCCALVMLYMGDLQLDPSDKDKDVFREKDNAINAASGSSRLVLIIRELFDITRSSTQLADEVYARVLKQLCKNHRAASVEAGWSLLLLLCSHVGCSVTMLRFLMLILNKCIAVERDWLARSAPNPWYAAHVVMLSLSHHQSLRADGSTPCQFVDAEVENSFRKLKHLSPLYSFIDEIVHLEQLFFPTRASFQILNFVPSTLVLLTDLIHARGGFRTDGIFRLAGERSCVARVRASISCRFPIVEADSDPLVLAEVAV